MKTAFVLWDIEEHSYTWSSFLSGFYFLLLNHRHEQAELTWKERLITICTSWYLLAAIRSCPNHHAHILHRHTSTDIDKLTGHNKKHAISLGFMHIWVTWNTWYHSCAAQFSTTTGKCEETACEVVFKATNNNRATGNSNSLINTSLFTSYRTERVWGQIWGRYLFQPNIVQHISSWCFFWWVFCRSNT